MKKLILIFALALIGCSEDDLSYPYEITLKDRCMEIPLTVYTTYGVSEETYHEFNSRVFDNCYEVTITDIAGNEVSGYYGQLPLRD